MKVGRFFTLDEFRCRDAKRTPVPAALVPNVRHLACAILDPIRERWGRPIYVVSGYRTAAHNKSVGGALRSTHMTAEAADIRPADVSDAVRFAAVIERLLEEGHLPALGGLGLYPGWVHVDGKQVGHLRRWTGGAFGAEPPPPLGSEDPTPRPVPR